MTIYRYTKNGKLYTLHCGNNGKYLGYITTAEPYMHTEQFPKKQLDQIDHKRFIPVSHR